MKPFATVTLFSFLAIGVGCQSSSVQPQNSAINPTVPTPESAPAAAAPKSSIAIGYNWRGDWNYTNFQIVEIDQGTLAADTLDSCHASFVAGSEISNRRRDECDRIAAKGLKIQMRRDAEEKRKDDAYDKAHHLQPAR